MRLSRHPFGVHGIKQRLSPAGLLVVSLAQLYTKIFHIIDILLTRMATCFIFRNMSNSRDEQIENYAEMFKALSNPNRLKIFLRLAALCMPGCCMPEVPVDISKEMQSEGCACVGDLGKDLDIVASTISHHIKELREAGLINVSRRGQHMNCWVDPGVVRNLMEFFEDCILEENIS